jgi:hypothetical protein
MFDALGFLALGQLPGALPLKGQDIPRRLYRRKAHKLPMSGDGFEIRQDRNTGSDYKVGDV